MITRLLFTTFLTITLTSSSINPGTNPNDEWKDIQKSCNKKSFSYQNKYQLQRHYIPSQDHIPVKTIKIALHIWQNDSGGNNWDPINDTNHVARLNQIVKWINSKLSKVRKPSHPILPPEDELKDSKIRIEVQGMYTYQIGKYHKSISLNTLSKYVFDNYPNRIDHVFPIHITNGKLGGASGLGQMPSNNIKSKHAGIVTFHNTTNPVSDYSFSSHLLHEIGHNLGLRHTYVSGTGGGNEVVKSTHKDFLWDVFGAPPGKVTPHLTPRDSLSVSYHEGYFQCDYKDPNTTCTNNMMGGTSGSGYISPLQAGRMHRSLALSNMRQYVKGSPVSTTPVEITEDEEIDFNLRLYSNVVIKPGVTLTVLCELNMPRRGTIVVEKGGELVVVGLISSESAGTPGWLGKIIVEPGGLVTIYNSGKLEFRKKGKIILKETGREKGIIRYESNSIAEYKTIIFQDQGNN
ncbi:MAG: hypothetical protein IH948_05185 [Bacteroidetes bacterium]|nr:hypothetical protein [Bacteroidota bacterium]